MKAKPLGRLSVASALLHENFLLSFVLRVNHGHDSHIVIMKAKPLGMPTVASALLHESFLLCSVRIY